MRTKASEIKAELKELGVDFSDCFDKEGLADKLVWARVSAAPKPPPRGAASGDFEFGVETRQGEDMSMDDAFKAAGWTGEEPSDPSKVDTQRSPGLNRNFGDISTTDFKKPYRGGG